MLTECSGVINGCGWQGLILAFALVGLWTLIDRFSDLLEWLGDTAAKWRRR